MSKNPRKFDKKKSPTEKPPGIDPVIWGPLVWNLFNDISIILDTHLFSEKLHNHGVNFFTFVEDLLPCIWCRESYSKFIKTNPPKYPFIDWVYNIHDKVNTKLEKKSISIKDFKKRCIAYSSFGNADQLLDLNYILALNYVGGKKKIYKQWFTYQKFWVPQLIKYKNYNNNALLIIRKIPNYAFKTSLNMIKYLKKIICLNNNNDLKCSSQTLLRSTFAISSKPIKKNIQNFIIKELLK